ncbi:TetR/AcrR family transcriptional regulator [Methanobacterium alcaliphilum]|uniref:TetR/AcrR family transcriptional regulator n=1 Tax=Methanobacterium alcaliphilum TaxID=392018 RepID=UPI00200B2F39|nr:TetR/AcrR family transcriptional regulator [Methanobacterium alcaliphilum]MCK9151921.1 TetR/AcrR family transcriptional regulator [Methanobacterium alcaliphilum]
MTSQKSTKEKIFDVSIDLFSQKGFNAVSIRQIGRGVGIRESSIYNHYSNKEAILDSILSYFIKEMEETGIPEDEMEILLKQSPEMFYHAGSKMFEERMNNPQMIKIWRLLLIEMYHNPKIKEFFLKELIEAPIEAWTLIFTMMIENKVIKPVNPERLAREYFSYAIYLLIENFVLKYPDNPEKFLRVMFDDMEEHMKFILESVKLK